MTLLRLSLLAALSGCVVKTAPDTGFVPVDTDTDTDTDADADTDTDTDTDSEGTDEDADGVSAADGDCDDNNADVHPGAPEVRDGVDNDCDGFVDESGGDDTGGFDTGFGGFAYISLIGGISVGGDGEMSEGFFGMFVDGDSDDCEAVAELISSGESSLASSCPDCEWSFDVTVGDPIRLEGGLCGDIGLTGAEYSGINLSFAFVYDYLVYDASTYSYITVPEAWLYSYAGSGWQPWAWDGYRFYGFPSSVEGDAADTTFSLTTGYTYY